MVKNGERRGENIEEPGDSRHRSQLYWTSLEQGKSHKIFKYAKYSLISRTEALEDGSEQQA